LGWSQVADVGLAADTAIKKCPADSDSRPRLWQTMPLWFLADT
jgi:hypothetical protein